MNGRFTMHNGDCVEWAKSLPSDSIDTVVTDPPYGQTNEKYDGEAAPSLRPELWSELYRASADDAALLSFAGGPTYHKIASAIELGGWKVRQMWLWIYQDGFITSAYPKEGFDRLAPAADPIVFATKGKVLLPLKREGSNKWSVKRGTSRIGYSDRSGGHGAESAVGHYPRAVVSDGIPPFEYFALNRTSRDASSGTGHPNEKPLDLMDWLLSKVPGDVVCDPFAGSGTTGVAAIMRGRKFVGCEINQDYYRKAVARLANTKKKISMGIV